MIRGMTTTLHRGDGPVVLIHEHISGGGLAEPLPASWLAEGSAMRRALAEDFTAARARVITTRDDRLPPDSDPGEVVRVAPGSGCAAVVRIAREVDFTIVIAPETGGLLADLTRAVAESGGRSLGGSPEAIDLAGDKLRLADHLERAGVPTPPSRRVRPAEGLPRDFPYPAVLKPIDGAGSLDTLLVEDPDDPIRRDFPHDEGLLQPFAAGEPRSATFLGLPGGPPRLLGVARQRISRTRGCFAYEGGSILLNDLEVDHPARRAAASIPGLLGLFGVDYLQGDHGDGATVLEINPRPTTSCVGLVPALGAGRLAASWLAGFGPPPPDETHDVPRPRHPVSFLPGGTLLPPTSPASLGEEIP